MEQSHSWEANRFSASYEIPCIYGTQSCITGFTNSPVLIPNYSNTVHAPILSNPLPEDPSYLYPPISGSSKWSLSPSFPHQNPVYTSPILHACYMSQQSHSSRLDHSNNTGWGVNFVLQAEACSTDTTPTQPHRNSNIHRTKNNTTNVVIQQNSRKLLMMSILMSETCCAHKKWNKIASDIKLVFYSSTITMMHGPINLKYFKIFV